MRIVVDVMGGDHGCEVPLGGIKLALERFPALSRIFAVGHQDQVGPALAKLGLHDSRIEIVHASEVLTMEDKPVEGLRRKKDCSILRALEVVKDGRADAIISPGNTGGLVAGSAIRLGKLEGVERPAIATVIPSVDNEFVLLDSGANVECRPIHLAHFAVMGSVYSRVVLGHQNPRVGLLSNGTEDNKGTSVTQSAFKLVNQLGLNFVGNVEGHDLFRNKVDVVVCDGFVGNIVLKTVESFAKGLVGLLKKELTSNPVRMLGAALANGALRNLKRRMDPDAYGGASILGLNGNVLKAHGSAKERAIMNAIRVSTEAVQTHLTELMLAEIRRANERIEAFEAALQPQATSVAP